jgi:hypothetical protein
MMNGMKMCQQNWRSVALLGARLKALIQFHELQMACMGGKLLLPFIFTKQHKLYIYSKLFLD